MIFCSKISKSLLTKSPTSSQSQSPNCYAWFSSLRSSTTAIWPASPPASPGRPATVPWSTAGRPVVPSLAFASPVSPPTYRKLLSEPISLSSGVSRSKDEVFTRACNGIVHISITVTPGFALPAFVSLVDDDGTTDKRMLVHTDAFRRCCSRCGTTGHVAQFCRAGHWAPGDQEALWSVLRIPADLLRPAESAAAVLAPVAKPTVQQAPPPREDHPLVKSALHFLAGKHQPQLQQQQTAAATDSERAALVSSTPSSSTMPGGGSLTGSVAAAREVVAPPGGGSAGHWGDLFRSRRRRQWAGGKGLLYTITLYNARRQLSQSECCRR
jgi:hypothetical protein